MQRYINTDFLDAVRALDGPTAADVAERLGCSASTARRRMAALIEAGKLERIRFGRVYRYRIASRPTTKRVEAGALDRLRVLAEEARANRERHNCGQLAALRALAEQGRDERAPEFQGAA